MTALTMSLAVAVAVGWFIFALATGRLALAIALLGAFVFGQVLPVLVRSWEEELL